MSISKINFRYLISGMSGILLLSVAASATAQVGTMDYGPAEIVPVPMGGGVFLMVLGLLLATIACWKISRGGFSGNWAASVLLAMGAIGFTTTGGHLLYDAYATSNDLSNPLGGTVDVFPGYQEYENTSGALLRILALDVDECNIPESSNARLAKSGASPQALPAYPECVPDSTVLAHGEVCTTDYDACAGERITQRAGYYWVRADYAAPQGDHGSVCAEFGLVATSNNVTLTWDETLLTQLSSDFGYLSNGDDQNSAQAMWCWDGDGGPYTPAGSCETHNFGDFFTNYGIYGSDPDIRPVYTCMEVP